MAKKRKTRKDKVIADLKRKLAKKRLISPKLTHITLDPSASEPKLPKLNSISDNINSKNNFHLKKDLTKSLGLAILVIVFELVVYCRLR